MRFKPLPRRLVAQTAVVLLAIGIVGLPSLVGAQRQDKDPSAERAAVRARKADVASQVDALEATDDQVTRALSALQANVAGQEARLAEAQRAANAAEQAYQEAIAAVEAKGAEIEGLKGSIREFAVNAFIHPPADDAISALNADNPSESAEKRALLAMQNQSDIDLLDALSAAEEDLQVRQGEAERAKVAADAKQSEVETRLTEVTRARDQQAAYGAQVQARLDRALSEAAALEELDQQLSAEIQRRQEELARQAAAALAAQRAAEAAKKSSSSSGSSGGGSRPVNIGPGAGGLASVSCSTGGSITVAASIAGTLQSL
ncbi:MAG: hypothetical protein AB7L84_13380, partial [Acidimicrobiia bacterium]